nr:MAG TPA: hypothetical protein [Bacteriophage sp.]
MEYSMLCGMRIIIVQDAVIQNRRHKKKRINKKWRKRYGVSVQKRMEDGQTIMFGENLYMNSDTYLKLKKAISQDQMNLEDKKYDD